MSIRNLVLKLFVPTLIVVSLFSFAAPRAHAFPVVDVQQLPKEFALDTIAYILGDIALEVITQDIVAWINSGFQGSPAFVQDPGQFFRNVGDYAAGAVFQELGAGFLCSPFSLDLRYVIELGYYQTSPGSSLEDKYTCTLGDIEDNVDDFFDDFREGDFDDFIQIAAEPGNNPYALAVGVRREIDARINEQQIEQDRLLDYGAGFLSFRECLEVEDPNTGEVRQQQGQECDGPVQTPGSIVEGQLGDSLSIGRHRLSVSDEINEIVGALLTQVVRQALGGAGGLLGTTSSSPGNPSLIDRTPSVIDPAQRDQIIRSVEEGIESGDEIISANNRALSPLRRAENALEDARVCYETSDDTNPALDVLTDRQEEMENQIDALETENDAISAALPDLRILLRDLQDTTDRERFGELADRFNILFKNGGVKTEAEIEEADTRATDLAETAQEYEAYADAKLSEC